MTSSPRAAMGSDSSASASADALHPSPPRSKPRSSRPNTNPTPRRSPNPNPRPRPDLYGSEPSRKSDRKRKPRTYPDSAADPALALPAAKPSSAAAPAPAVALWTHSDELALLTGAAAFRAGSGRAPRKDDTGPLFESIRDSLSPHIDHHRLYLKLKRLKGKFCNTSLSAHSTPHDRRVRDLSADVWGDYRPPTTAPPAADSEAEEESDPEDAVEVPAVGRARMPLVTELLGEYWTSNASALSGVSLEKGLARIGAEEGRVAEAKWRRQIDAEMRTQQRHHDLAKEVFGLLIDTVKGLGP